MSGATAEPAVLVMAKAPVPGLVKTRLGERIGMALAAEVAAAALLDTLAAVLAYLPGAARRFLALDGELSTAVRGAALQAALETWTVFPQAGDGLAERLASAHAAVPGPRLQIGMDTPQLAPSDLTAAASGLRRADVVLGPAMDGGWWVLGLRAGELAAPLRSVEMSTEQTHGDTHRALRDGGLGIETIHRLHDVDTVADARTVAESGHDGEFTTLWRRLESEGRIR
ncbi:MAG: TIGR04282 family arsenosugar biosynthesis glycosyltransferase [Nocardioides sp.]